MHFVYRKYDGILSFKEVGFPKCNAQNPKGKDRLI